MFAPDRLDLAAAERFTAVLDATEKAEFAAALHVDDPRWNLNLVIFAIFVLAAYLPAVDRNRVERRHGSFHDA